MSRPVRMPVPDDTELRLRLHAGKIAAGLTTEAEIRGTGRVHARPITDEDRRHVAVVRARVATCRGCDHVTTVYRPGCKCEHPLACKLLTNTDHDGNVYPCRSRFDVAVTGDSPDGCPLRRWDVAQIPGQPAPA